MVLFKKCKRKSNDPAVALYEQDNMYVLAWGKLPWTTMMFSEFKDIPLYSVIISFRAVNQC